MAHYSILWPEVNTDRDISQALLLRENLCEHC